MKIIIEYQDQFSKWRRYGMKHSQLDAFRTAQNRAHQTGVRHRLIDEYGCLVDLVEP